jgi:hypothetical protein
MAVMVNAKEATTPLAEGMTKEKEVQMRDKPRQLPRKEGHQDQALDVQMVAALLHYPRHAQV